MKISKKLLIIGILAVLFSGCSEDTIDSFGRGTIAGKVVNEGANTPLENVKISTSPSTSTVFTDENGDFIIEDVPEGDYSVQAGKDGLLTQFQGATVLSNAEVNIIFEVSPESANNRSPSTPQAIAPEDNATEVNLPVKFAWTSSDPEGDTLTYEIELRNDINDEIQTFSNIADTTFTAEGLNAGVKYFWQIKVSDSINDPVLSPIFTFETSGSQQRRFTYVRKQNGNSVIFSGNEEEDQFQLTSSNSNSFNPRKNNSVNKIAFLRTVGGNTHIFTMNTDGSNQKQITSSIPVNSISLEKVGFSWANDGTEFIYPSLNRLYKIDASGGGNSLVYKAPEGRFITNVDVSDDSTVIAIITTNVDGYDSKISLLDRNGNFKKDIINAVDGYLGGLDVSVDNKWILYTRDVSGFENENNRQLDSRIFIYNRDTGENRDLSRSKPDGTNDLNPEFSPTNAEVVFVNALNDSSAVGDIYTLLINNTEEVNFQRNLLFENAQMPNWE